MKIKLLVREKIWHEKGETVEVSPDVADFLISIHAAEMIKAETPKKGTKKNDKDDKKTYSD